MGVAVRTGDSLGSMAGLLALPSPGWPMPASPRANRAGCGVALGIRPMPGLSTCLPFVQCCG